MENATKRCTIHVVVTIHPNYNFWKVTKTMLNGFATDVPEVERPWWVYLYEI